MYNKLIENLSKIITLCHAAQDVEIEIDDKIIERLDMIVKNVRCTEKYITIQPMGYNKESVPDMTIGEINTARFDGKINAIKAYKDRTKLSIIQCKYAVEKAMENRGLDFKSYKV